MKKATKILSLLLAAVLLVGATVAGTLAYLTDDATVTNNFTVGDVKITMTEQKVNTDGTPVSGADRVTTNDYQLFPGRSYTKDPTIYIDATSEDAWLFVKVTNAIEDIEADTNTIAAQMTTNGWAKVDGTDVYAYKEIVEANDVIPVFGSFEIDGDVDGTALADYEDTQIVVVAYAIQADGFSSAADAWTNASSSFKN